MWSPATGLDNPTSATPIATPTETTTYTVTATDASGCDVTGEVTITVIPELLVDAGPDQEICLGEEVQLDAQVEIGFSDPSFYFINSTLDSRFGAPASLFNGQDDTGTGSFHAIRDMAGQDWGIGYLLNGPQAISAVSLDRRNGIPRRGEGGVVQIFNNGTMVYQSNPLSGPGEDELFATPDIMSIVGDEVRYIFLNGANTDNNDSVLNFSEWNIYIEPAVYEWTPTSSLSNPNIADPIASPTTSTTYTVTVTDANGCTATDDVVVDVITLPSDFVTTSLDATCGEDFGSITITWTQVAGLVNVEFSLDGGVTYEPGIPDANETVTFIDLAPGDYDLFVRRGDDLSLIHI